MGISPRKVAHAGSLDLDDACAQIGQLPRAKRRSDRVFSLNQNDRGSPRMCSAT